MKLLVAEHVLGEVLFPTHHNVMLALNALPEGVVGWYSTKRDLNIIMRGYGIESLDLAQVPEDVSMYMASRVMWELLQCQPQSLMFFNGHVMLSLVQTLSAMQVTRPLFMMCCDDPHEFSFSSRVSPYCSASFTVEPHVVDLHKDGVLLEHAVVKSEIDTLREMVEGSRLVGIGPDILVAGTLFENRVEWLNAMVPVLQKAAVGKDIRLITHRTPLVDKLDPFWVARRVQPVHWNQLQQLYLMSKCVLNMHRTADSSLIASNLGMAASSLNQTTFSVPAMGGVLLSDNSREESYQRAFSGALPTYSTPEEMAMAALAVVSGGGSQAFDIRERCHEAQGIVFDRHLWVEHRLPVLVDVFAKNGVDLTQP